MLANYHIMVPDIDPDQSMLLLLLLCCGAGMCMYAAVDTLSSLGWR